MIKRLIILAASVDLRALVCSFFLKPLLGLFAELKPKLPHDALQLKLAEEVACGPQHLDRIFCKAASLFP